MRKLLYVGFILFWLALDWAALHDILKGVESDLSAEFAALGLSVVVFAVLISIGLKSRVLRRR